MEDAMNKAQELADRYVAVWNEVDAARRRHHDADDNSGFDDFAKTGVTLTEGKYSLTDTR